MFSMSLLRGKGRDLRLLDGTVRRGNSIKTGGEHVVQYRCGYPWFGFDLFYYTYSAFAFVKSNRVIQIITRPRSSVSAHTP